MMTDKLFKNYRAEGVAQQPRTPAYLAEDQVWFSVPIC